MAVVEIHPQPIRGPWSIGFVLDKHIVSSVHTGDDGAGHPQFDNVRTPLGELVFLLKNRAGLANDIIDTASAFAAMKWPNSLDGVVCPPPSAVRRRQPAIVIAKGIAIALGISMIDDAVVKQVITKQMKNVPGHERRALLAKAIQPGPAPVTGRRVLLVDDLWDTGETMRRTADVLFQLGVADVKALVMTRTKS